MSLFIIIILIAIIIKLRQDNISLKNDLENIKEKEINFCPNCGYELNNEQIEPLTIQYNTDTELSIQQNTENNSKNKEFNEKEIKNSLLLITGSVLIIISAIVFLTTTWNVTHNFIKTFVIILMLFVFLAASYIADKKLNLKQTAKTFYYIALAYIPIILLSIGLFSLLGNYLSLKGEGKYIYLCLSSLITTLIYYYNAKKRKSNLIEISSVIFSIITVLFLALSINSSNNTVIILLSMYTTLLSILYTKNYNYLNQSIHLKTINTLVSSLTIVTLYNNIYNIINTHILLTDIIVEILLLYLIQYYLNRIKNRKDIYNKIYPLYIIFIFFNLSFLFKDFIIKQLLIITSYLIIFIYNILKENKINQEAFIEILITGIILYCETIIKKIIGIEVIPTFLIMGIISLLSYISYYYTYNNKKIAYILRSTMMITILDIVLTYELSSI